MDRSTLHVGRRLAQGRLPFAAGLLLLLSTACHLDALFSDSPSETEDGPAAPAKMEFATQPSAALVGEPISPPPEIVVRDSAGEPDTTFNGPVALSLDGTGSGATLEGTTTRDAVRGMAAFPGLAIDRPGEDYRLVATASGVRSVSSATFDITAPPEEEPDPTDLVIVSGNGQTGTVGLELASTYVVRVTDAAGDPVPGVAVAWTVTAGGGSVLPAASTTNGSGQSSATHTLGLGIGAHSVRATVTGLDPVTFTATASAATAAVLVFTEQPTDAAVGEAISPAVEITARDLHGNRATTFNGTVTLTLGGGSGTLGGTTARAATAGIVTFPGLTVSAAGASYRISAAASGVSGVTSAAFEIVAPDEEEPEPASIEIVSGNGQGGTVGEQLGSPYVVRVTDAEGDPVPGVSVAWVVTSGGGSVSTSTTSTNSSGQASTTHTLGTGTGSQSVQATVVGLSPITFTATASADAPAELIFTVQPSDAGMGETISPPVRVAVRDRYGNSVTDHSGSITLSIVPLTGTPLASLDGTRTRTVSAGVATFDDLSISLLGVGYRLRASGAGLSVDSAPFTILLP